MRGHLQRIFAGQAQEYEKQGVHNEHTCWEERRMNISGIRPKQEFYAGVEKQEPEKKNASTESGGYPYGGNAASFSEEPMNGPAAAVKLWQIRFGIMTGKLLL